MKRIVLLLFVLGMVLPSKLFAWGMLGHRVIGGIAEHYLNTRAKAEVKRLLGNESVAMAGNWADFIKSDRSYDYLGPWHYINFNPGLTKREMTKLLKEDTGVDLYTKLNFLVGELKSRRLQRDKQVFYLRLLIHLVADAHQPMHMGQYGDRGGNNVKVYWFGEPTNLHRVWDEHLIEFQQLSYTEHVQALNFISPDEKSRWMKQPMSDWIYESYEIAQKLYGEVKAED